MAGRSQVIALTLSRRTRTPPSGPLGILLRQEWQIGTGRHAASTAPTASGPNGTASKGRSYSSTLPKEGVEGGRLASNAAPTRTYECVMTATEGV